MNHITLNDGNSLPILGFGTYKTVDDEGIQSVKNALACGYRLIDTAAKYANEEAVGQAIIESDIDRNEIIVTSKLWRENLGYESALKAFETSRKKLNLSYIDVYLIHWPANAKNYDNWQKTNAESWRALEALQANGLIRTIGVSNFWEEHLEALFQTAHIIPALNQIEFHPGYWQESLSNYCKSKGIVVESWSPLARGKVFGNEVLEHIANHHKKSISQICLRWVTQHNAIVIPKASALHKMEENFNIFDFELSANEMQQINDIPTMGFSGELPNHWPEIVTQ